MRQALFQHLDGVFNELDRHFNPAPPAPEPDVDVIYLPEDEIGSPHLGTRNFNVKLFSSRWG
jgi:hypothetical protein